MKLIIFGISLLGAVTLIVWLSNFPGLITLHWFGYTIELNPVVFVGLIVSAFLLFLGVYKIFAFFMNLPQRFRNYREDRRVQSGLHSLTQALVSLASGDGKEAMRQAQNAKGKLRDSPLADFFTAKAAQLQGNEDKARDCLHELSHHSETSLLGIKGLMSYAQKENNTTLITHLAQRAYRLKEDTPWVLNILLDHAIQSQNWSEAFKYAQKMEYYHFWTAEEYNRKRALLFILQALESQTKDKIPSALDDLQRAHRLIPNAFESNYALAQLWIKIGEFKKARKLLTKIWPLKPHRDLATLFKSCLQDKPESARLHLCEEFVASAKDHKESKIFLIQTYIDAKIWGKARHLLNNLLQKEPSKDLCYLMAQLEESEYHHHDQANAWLHKAKDYDASEKWVCQSCQTIHAYWSPICNHCQSFDEILFQTPRNSASQPSLLLIEKDKNPFSLVDL